MRIKRYHRKLRQLKYVVKLLKKDLSPASVAKLRAKMQRLLKSLSYVVPKFQLKKLVAPVLFVSMMGMTQHSMAQTFAPPVQQPFGLIAQPENEYTTTSFADIDADGDLDMFLHDYYSQIKFYENTGNVTEPNFAAPIDKPFGLQLDTFGFMTNANFQDIDNDGDLDLFKINIINDSNDDLIIGVEFHENTGSPTEPSFAAPVIDPFGLEKDSITNIKLVDADGDGDLDIFGIKYIAEYELRFTYTENIGTPEEPNFTTNIVESPFGIDVPGESPYNSMDFADMDNDGDLDFLLTQSIYDNTNENAPGKFSYYENIGDQNNMQFAAPQVDPANFGITGSYLSVAAADLDGDGDQDLMFSWYDNQFTYYENSGLTSTKDLINFDFKIFPNPASEYLNVRSEEVIQRIEILNLEGKLILQSNDVNGQIPIRQLPDGGYILKVIDQKNFHGSKVFFKK